jgi:hypothetical protein
MAQKPDPGIHLPYFSFSFISIECKQACKTIANLVDRATITGMVGYEGGGGSMNIQVCKLCQSMLSVENRNQDPWRDTDLVV